MLAMSSSTAISDLPARQTCHDPHEANSQEQPDVKTRKAKSLVGIRLGHLKIP